MGSSSKRRMGNCRRRTSSSSWSDLFPEIIQSISQHLKSRFDILSFRRVCKRWREHSVPLSPNFLSPLLPYRIPCTLPSHFYNYNDPDSDSHLDLVVKSIYLITPIVVENGASVSSWMVMATELEPGKTLLRHPLTGGEIEHLPKAIDLTQFQVSELAQCYTLHYSHSHNVSKVVLCSNSSASPALFTVSDCTAMIVDSHGWCSALRLSENVSPGWSTPRCRGDILFHRLDDIAIFKGIHVGVDLDGRLFSLAYEPEESSPVVVTGILAENVFCNSAGRRKRLVVDPLSDKLYLVERERLPRVRFQVYEYNEECKKWVKVGALCHYRALFVGVSHCFLAPAPVGCLANCIVFAADSFPLYRGYSSLDHQLFSDRNAKERIGVYALGKRWRRFSFISDYPELLQMMEPLPACFSSSERESNEDEEMQSNSNSQDDSSQSNEDEDIQSDSNSEDDSSQPNEDEEVQSGSISQVGQSSSREDEDVRSVSNSRDQQAAESYSTSAAQGDVTVTPTMNEEVEHVAEEAETPREEIVHSVTMGYITSLTRKKSNTSTLKFEGLEIRPELVPTLEKIWSKHGNVIENSSMRNGDMVARGLELLATVVHILDTNSARSLTDNQTDYLRSALCDLECMRFQVDWLLPMVAKALALHKSKPLVDSLNKLSLSRAKVAERRLKLLDELAENDKWEKELMEDMARISKTIPFSGEVDLDQPLGGGLS